MDKVGTVNILIVDDMPEAREALQDILGLLGENVVAVASGQEALASLDQRSFALIILNVKMPDIDGFATAELIRKRPDCESTPIIFVSANSNQADRLKGYALGAVDFIQTPIPPTAFRTKIGLFVELFRRTSEAKKNAIDQLKLAQTALACEVASKAHRRSALIADASRLLSRSLDFDDTLSHIRRVLVPRLADSCEIELLADLTRSMGTNLRMNGPEDEGSAACDPFEEVPEDLPDVPNKLFLPLIARGHRLGFLHLTRTDRRFSDDDVSTARELADRAAIALDNSRLYRLTCNSEKRKDQFLAMLGHELRNPLAAINGAIEIMASVNRESELFEEAQQILGRQTRLMRRLVDDLLDASRLNSGRIQLKLETLDAIKPIQQAIRDHMPAFHARNQSVQVSMPEGPFMMLGDATRLEQIAANLLTNASKFTDDGGVIEISAERHDTTLVLRVKDNGIGIGQETLSQIFEPFLQGELGLDRTNGGLGVGLVIVRGLVSHHGGTVGAYSEGIGRGSEFVVSLPGTDSRHVSEAATILASSPLPSAPLTTLSARVLLVEDQKSVAWITESLLRILGHEFMTVIDGPAALEVVENFSPTVILLDIGLPGMNGFELARAIRQRLGDRTPRLVALTAYTQETDRRMARDAGFNDHIMKPVSMSQLMELFHV